VTPDASIATSVPVAIAMTTGTKMPLTRSARRTPGAFESATSMRRAHAAHVIPVIGKSTRSASPSGVDRLRRRRHDLLLATRPGSWGAPSTCDPSMSPQT
jgi:hypothetical protein